MTDRSAAVSLSVYRVRVVLDNGLHRAPLVAATSEATARSRARTLTFGHARVAIVNGAKLAPLIHSWRRES